MSRIFLPTISHELECEILITHSITDISGVEIKTKNGVDTLVIALADIDTIGYSDCKKINVPLVNIIPEWIQDQTEITKTQLEIIVEKAIEFIENEIYTIEGSQGDSEELEEYEDEINEVEERASSKWANKEYQEEDIRKMIIDSLSKSFKLL